MSAPNIQDPEDQREAPGPHRLFSIHEMICQVFMWLSPGRASQNAHPTNQKTLAGAAHVCKAFQDPALDVLWRDVEFSRPWKIMQMYASDSDKRCCDNPDVHISEPLSDHRVQRVLFYSRRIHTLGFNETWFYSKDTLMNMLIELTNMRPLFPLVNSLDWRYPILDVSILLAILSHSPVIRSVKVHITGGARTFPDVLGAFLQTLHPIAPIIQQLSLPGISAASMKQSYGLLAGFEAVRSLECLAVSLSMLRVCAGLKNLAMLKINLSTFPLDDCDDLCFPTVHSLRVEASMNTTIHFLRAVTFPLLTSLEFSAWGVLPLDDCDDLYLPTVHSLKVEASMDTIIHFLRAVTFPLLTSLEFFEAEGNRREVFPLEDPEVSCFNTVRILKLDARMDAVNYFLRTMSYPLLTSLELFNMDARAGNWNSLLRRLDTFYILIAPILALRALSLQLGPTYSGDVLLLTIIKPLLQVHQLEDVTISTGNSSVKVSMFDDDLRMLASAWPDLRTLSIAAKFQGSKQPRIQALAEFARCPALHSLRLPSIVVDSKPGPVPAVCKSVRHLAIASHDVPPPIRPASLPDFNMDMLGYRSPEITIVPLRRPVLEARFLHEMFPNVAGNEEENVDSMKAWKGVNEIWAALRAGEDVKEPEFTRSFRMDRISWYR